MRRYFLLIIGLSLGVTIQGQGYDSVLRIMTDHLKHEGKNPVHSIQVFISNGTDTLNAAIGNADGIGVKAFPENQFKVASITKTFTAVVILQMAEEGYFNLDDKIYPYLKDVAFLQLDKIHIYKGKRYGSEITIRQLLQHKTGLADIFTDGAFRFYLSEYLNKKQTWSPEKLINRYYKYGLQKSAHFEPDSGYYYSDVNYFLLGILAEKLSKRSLAQLFREGIFGPLQMRDSYLEYYEFPMGHGKMAHSFLGKRDITKTLNTSYDWAGGGIVSTTQDLAKFLTSLFDQKLFRSDSSLVQMTTMIPHPLKSGATSYYGLGLYQYNFNGDIYFGHGGFWGSIIAYSPVKKIVFCGSINQVNPPFRTSAFVSSLLKNFESDLARKSK